MINKKIHFFIAIAILSTLNLHACYIDLSKNDLTKHIGSDLIFDTEYEAQEEHQQQVSFLRYLCFPVRLETTGNTRWFFTSALEGSNPYLGEAINITNQAVTHVALVSGETRNSNWFYVYFGFDIHNPKFYNLKHTVYQGNLLYIVCKNSSYMISNNAKYLESQTIELEIRKHLPDKKDHDPNSPAFQSALKNLFLKKAGSFYTCDRLLSSASFWPTKNT